MKTKLHNLSLSVSELRRFIENTVLPEFPVEVPAYGVIVNPRAYLKTKLEQLEGDPDSLRFRQLIKNLELIKKHLNSLIPIGNKLSDDR